MTKIRFSISKFFNVCLAFLILFFPSQNSANPPLESSLTTFSGYKSVRIWHQEGTNASLSRYLGYFSAGDTVTVSLKLKANAGVYGEIFLGDAGGIDPYDNYSENLQQGNGSWQTLSTTLVLSHADDVWVYVYGNVSGSDPANKTNVIYDDIVVSSIEQGQLWAEGFEYSLALTTDYWDMDGWRSAGQPNDWMSASSGSAFNGRNAVRVWHQEGTNASLSRYLGYFNAGDQVTVSLKFKANANVYGEFLLGDAGGADPYDNVTGNIKEGNGDWQSLSATQVLSHGDHMWVYIYGNVSEYDPSNITSIIYDDIVVTRSGTQARVWIEGFENGLAQTTDYWDVNAWRSAGQPNNLVSAPSFTLWQLPSTTPLQINSYVLKTAANGKLIVVDGGMPEDAESLKNFINNQGGHVDMWFVSHPHIDHVGALTEILANPGSLTIDHIYASMLDTNLIEQHEGLELQPVLDFIVAVENAQKTIEDLDDLGEIFLIDGVTIEILAVKTGITVGGNLINNSSVVMRVSDAYKSVLFTGDLGAEGGDEITGVYRSRLKSDYVQMSHHGSHGVKQDFYMAVNPKYCLWPTPQWLYDTQDPQYTTPQVRSWMEDLCVGPQSNFLMFNGIQVIN